MTGSSQQMWAYRDATIGQQNLSGLSVEAVDGSIGKVDDATNDVGQSFIVVDTGPWIFGKKVLLPAGVINRVDLDTERSSSTGRRTRSRTRRSTTRTSTARMTPTVSATGTISAATTVKAAPATGTTSRSPTATRNTARPRSSRGRARY